MPRSVRAGDPRERLGSGAVRSPRMAVQHEAGARATHPAVRAAQIGTIGSRSSCRPKGRNTSWNDHPADQLVEASTGLRELVGKLTECLLERRLILNGAWLEW